MSETLHKTMTVKELSEEGSISAVISTFQKDRDGDLMTREALAGSDGKTIPMVWSHNWDQPVGKGVVKVNDGAAEFHGQFFRETDAGEQAYRTVKEMGDLQQYSIGFRVLDAVWEKQDGVSVRVFKNVELFEASPVLVGAAYGTHTIAVKEAAREEGFAAALKALAPIVLAGAVSDDDQHPLHEFLKQLSELHEAACSLDDCALKASDIPDLQTPERKAQVAEIDRLLSTIKL